MYSLLPNELINEIANYLCWYDYRSLISVEKRNKCLQYLQQKKNDDLHNIINKYIKKSYEGYDNLDEKIFGGDIKEYNKILYVRLTYKSLLIITPKYYSGPDYKNDLIDFCDNMTFMYICKCGSILKGCPHTVKKHESSKKHQEYKFANYYNLVKYDYIFKYIDSNFYGSDSNSDSNSD